LARKHAPEATFLEMDVLDLDFAEHSFDAVLDSAVMFHFSDEEQADILHKIYY
jgi:chemotaxis methyl-accepting protein methylase